MAKTIFNSDSEFLGPITATSIANATGDILTIDAFNVIKRRTTAEMLSDIGAAPAGSYALDADVVHKTGALAEDITGVKTFKNQTEFEVSLLMLENPSNTKNSIIGFPSATLDSFDTPDNTNSLFWLRGDYLNWKNLTQLNAGGRFTQTNTAIRTYTMQDASGTVAFTSDIPSSIGGSVTNDQIPFGATTANDIEGSPELVWNQDGISSGINAIYVHGDAADATRGGGIRLRSGDTTTLDFAQYWLASRLRLGTVTNHPMDITINNLVSGTWDTTGLNVAGNLTAATAVIDNAINANEMAFDWDVTEQFFQLIPTGAGEIFSYSYGADLWQINSSDIMTEANQSTITGNKVFGDGNFELSNVANTFGVFFTNTVTANRTYTLQDADGTIAFLSDITGGSFVALAGDTMTGALSIDDGTATSYSFNVHRLISGTNDVLSFISVDGSGLGVFGATDDTAGTTSSYRITPGGDHKWIDGVNGTIATLGNTGILDAVTGLTSNYIGLDKGTSVIDATTVFTGVSAPSQSMVMNSNSTSSTGYPGEFGNGAYFKGSTEARDFGFWRSNTNNNSAIYVGNKNGSVWVWNQIWHSGSDGSGSGLDADTLRTFAPTTLKTASTIVLRDSNGDTFSENVNAANIVTSLNVKTQGTQFWEVSAANDANQRFDSRSEGTGARMHMYGQNDSVTTGNTGVQWNLYDSGSYINFNVINDVVEFDTVNTNPITFRVASMADATLIVEADTDNVDEGHTVTFILSQDGGIKTYTTGLAGVTNDGMVGVLGNDVFNKTITAAEDIWWGGGTAAKMKLDNGDGELSLIKGVNSFTGDFTVARAGVDKISIQNGLTEFLQDTQHDATHARFYNGGRIRRYVTHNSGYLEGGYNTIASTNNDTSPIYAMGSSYLPNETTLSNMYGIGHCNATASFINATDLGTAGSGWGIYVASDGNARVWLDGSNGRVIAKNNMWAANFILHSDRRKKKNIIDVPEEKLNVRWRKFDFKKSHGGEKNRYGVIAQELIKTHPEFVDDHDPDALNVKYMDLFSAKHAEHERELAKKDKEISDLRSDLEEFKKLVKEKLEWQ